jgi:hypothetical protein
MRLTPRIASAISARPTAAVAFGRSAPQAPSCLSARAVRPMAMSSPAATRPICYSRTTVRMAGIKLKLKSRRAIVPKTIRPPNTLTGTICMKSSTAKAAAVASAV